MVINPFPQNEQARSAVLRRFENLYAAPEPSLDPITALVAWYFNAPISAIGLILYDHIIVKSLYGLEEAQTDRRAEWCAAAIAADDVFCITNALEDPLAKSDPLVAGELGLRFYAAAPLRTREGYSLGTLCVIDRKPRDISVTEKEFLRRMASLVVDLIESHLAAKRLSALIASLANEAPRFASLAAGKQLLQVLAENLAQALDVAYVFIGAPGEHGAEPPATVAFYAVGEATGHDQDYYLAASWPYAPLLRANQDEVYYTSKAQSLFLHERPLADLRIESYAGVRLTDPTLRGFGAIAILDIKPIKNFWLTRSALVAFAVLALAELKRRRAPSAGGDQPEISASLFRINFNQSIIGKPRQQQLAWLADQITGDSPAIQEARERLRLAIIKQTDSVLLIGETGTGKGVCALAIHEGSGARGRFIEVNCAALPRELIESELFGHEKGSFTGATGRKIGLFEQADGGTIFLDEIAELPPDLQVKLLSVLQGRELRRVGGVQAIPINVRVVAATNRPLEIALNDGTFRRDLFFRIGSWRVELPALRHRVDDVIQLARRFIAELVESKVSRVSGLAPEAEDLLKQYDWPGNVRQLSNVIKHAIILESGDVISPETIRRTLEEEKRLFNPDRPTAPRPSYKDLKRILITEAEARAITEALARNRNNKTRTAKELGLTLGQLKYRLKLIEEMPRL
jgi:two-component system response regulator AtoC